MFILDDKRIGTIMTFGYGPYSCIGKNFALLETKVVIARLLQNFRFSLDPEFEESDEIKQLLTVCVKPQIHIRFHDLKKRD